jgi:hypothetical protein
VNTQTPAPDPDDVERGIAALEAHLAARAGEVGQGAGEEPTAPYGEVDGETKRVRRLRALVAEAHRLAELQADQVVLRLDTSKVRKRRARAFEAARLHALAQDPVMGAYQAARFRRVLVGVAMVSLTLALAWSTAGVQAFASEGATAWSPGWVFAWLVEPFMSMALLVVVGAKAYLGAKGQPIESRTLDRVEGLFLGLTLGMNAWSHLPGVAHPFSLSRLVLHLLGPVVAVAVVKALPIVVEAFAGLDHGGDPTGLTGLTGPEYSDNASAAPPAGKGARADVVALTVRARALIAAGKLPADPSANALRQVLRCGMDPARQVRDALRDGDR